MYVGGCVGVTGQEAVLSISVKFADGTLTPLHYISPADYQLDVDTLNNHVVAFADRSSLDAASDWPRLMAVGAGSGELVKVSLQAAGACRRRKARPLAVTYAAAAAASFWTASTSTWPGRSSRRPTPSRTTPRRRRRRCRRRACAAADCDHCAPTTTNQRSISVSTTDTPASRAAPMRR